MGGAGGAGGNTVGNPGFAGQAGGNGTNIASGGGGGGGAHGFVGPALPTIAATGGAGGNGGLASATGSPDGGGGGAGGFGAVVTGTGNLGTLGVAATGGGGGNGGGGLNANGAFLGGNAGSGGAGFYATQGVTLTSTAGASGGAGGVGGFASVGPGSGGAGGNGFTFAGAGSSLTLTNTGSALAGNGGAGGNQSNASNGNSNGGVGGIGIQFVLGGGTLTNSGPVRGGDGGNSGTGGNANSGQGSIGGAGVSFGGTSGTLINTGTISGGFGGTSPNASRVGAGGVGVVGSGLTITNAGTIAGGLSGDGATRANAITFTSGTNRLELQARTANALYDGITGNVVVQTGNGATGTLALGGATNASFDAAQLGPTAQYQGFSAYEKTGTSIWTLTGTTTAVTPWTINQGTLAVSADNNLGSASGGLTFGGGTLEITADGFTSARGITLNTAGTVQTDPGVSATLSGVIADGAGGAGTLIKTGTGALTLSRASTYTGPTAVNAGTLNVTGSLTSAVTVNTGGILAGTAGATAGSGTIGGLSVASGGIVFPSAVSGAPGTLNVSGNVTFAAGSTFRVALTPTAGDRITATGTATIQGGTVDVRAGAGTYTPTTYTLLSATGGVTGTFTNLTTTTNLAFLSPTLSYGGNTVNLTLTQAAPVTSVATTLNQTGTGTAVQAAVTTMTGAAPTPAATAATPAATTSTAATPPAAAAPTPAEQVAVAVLNQTAPGAVQALNSLSGEVQASAISAQVQTAFLVQEAILDHLRFGEGNGFAGDFGLGGPGLTGAIGQRFAPGTTLPAAYSADLPGGPVIGLVPVRPVQPNYALWGQGFGAFGDTGGNGNAARLARQTGGFVLGIETGFGALSNALVSDLRVGVAAGYTFTGFDVTARQSTGSVESGFGAVYARGALGPVQMRVGAAYAGNALDTRRAVLFPGFSQSVTGKAGGDTVNGFGEVGYRVGFAQGYVEPFVGGAAIHIRRDGFSEIGGASALTVYGRSYDVQTATVGLQGQAVLSELFGTGTPIIARGLIGYRRAFGDVVPQALLAFGGGGQAFLTAGVPIARDALVASAGLDVQVARNVTLGLNYTGQVGERAQDHAIKGSFSYRW